MARGKHSAAQLHWVNPEGFLISFFQHFETELLSSEAGRAVLKSKNKTLIKKARARYKEHFEAKGWVLFDSKFEANYYIELLERQKLGEIKKLARQCKYYLSANGIEIGSYKPDFEYYDNKLERVIVVECKGRMTGEASLRIRVFLALYPDLDFVLIRQSKKTGLKKFNRKYKKVDKNG